MGINMAVAFANIFMATNRKPYLLIDISLLPTFHFLPPPYTFASPSYFSGPFLPPPYSALLSADVNLQRVEGWLWKSTNSDESGYVNFRLL